MNVERIEMRDFMSHKGTVIQLPLDGIVLVTGPNGAGKSSLAEAVSWGLWGKTLRGSTVAGCVVIDNAALHVERQRMPKVKNSLAWTSTTDETPAFDNATKAQAALEDQIGAYSVWRRTCVFSSQDASHFTLATDAERKRLLEDILGLDQFDPALAACRADLKAGEGQLSVEQLNHSALELKLAAAEQRLQDAEEGLRSLPPGVEVGEEAKALDGLRSNLTATKALATAARLILDNARGNVRERQTTLNHFDSQIASLSSVECPTCGQPWADLADREAKTQELQAAKDDLEKSTEGSEAVNNAQAEVNQLEEELGGIREEGTAVKAKVAAAAATEKERERLQKQGDEVMEQLGDIEEELSGAAERLKRLTAEVGALRAAEKVLGVKGVRAHVLGEALSGVESIANGWLQRIARVDAPLTLHLNPYTEKKTGGVSDAIKLEIDGAGGGTGYKGASGGERRRIDVALLLALSEIASASHGGGRGTMFFDEVFDSLDVDGTDAVISALQELAQDRAVVVISHNDDLINELTAATHLHVEEGTVQRV